MEAPKYRNRVREVLSSRPFMGEGGFETTLVFEKKEELPCFASFAMLMSSDESKRKQVELWQKQFLDVATSFKCGYWLDTKSWRANPEWTRKVGFEPEIVWKACLDSAMEFRNKYETSETPIIVSGVVGPRRDGYRLDPSVALSVDDAKAYHHQQIEAFDKGGVDLITVYTMNHFEEPAGIALACKELGMPVVISFTVETNGRLASDETLSSAIRRIDDISQGHPLFYMLNCAHPSHMLGGLEGANEHIRSRIKGFFPNSSRKSHAELDESTELDRGEPEKIGFDLFQVLTKYGYEPTVVGGCCGTSKDHVCSIGRSFMSSLAAEKKTPLE